MHQPEQSGTRRWAQPNSDVEADEALGRCAPSGLRSLTPVVGQASRVMVRTSDWARLSVRLL
jgi:hypothetical protein